MIVFSLNMQLHCVAVHDTVVNYIQTSIERCFFYFCQSSATHIVVMIFRAGWQMHFQEYNDITSSGIKTPDRFASSICVKCVEDWIYIQWDHCYAGYIWWWWCFLGLCSSHIRSAHTMSWHTQSSWHITQHLSVLLFYFFKFSLQFSATFLVFTSVPQCLFLLFFSSVTLSRSANFSFIGVMFKMYLTDTRQHRWYTLIVLVRN